VNDVQQNQGLIIMLSTNTGPGSGKTTAASFLHELNPTAVIVSFAYPLKTMLKELLYLWTGSEQESYEMVYGSLKETVIDGMGYDITPRKLMQTLGTEWREMIDKDLWVKLAILETEKHLLAGRTVLIDDLRFPHELELFRSHKWMCKTTVLHVNIDRPVGSVLFAGVEGQLFIHKSEGGLSGITPDFQINNTGSKEDLLNMLGIFVEKSLK
jgi:hypothetical protein